VHCVDTHAVKRTTFGKGPPAPGDQEDEWTVVESGMNSNQRKAAKRAQVRPLRLVLTIARGRGTTRAHGGLRRRRGEAPISQPKLHAES
jgi:hypothetical protein